MAYFVDDDYDRCCFGIATLTRGTVYIGIFEIICAFLFVVIIVTAFGIGSQDFIPSLMNLPLSVITGYLLLVGIRRDRPAFLLPYLVFVITKIIFIIIVIVLCVTTMPFVPTIIPSVYSSLVGHLVARILIYSIWASLLVWFFVIVCRCFRAMKISSL
ncbi:unnamed protein product [Soboliphyme baturini]|uniref:Vesicle transport protein n=1 Tax=Soboliphyme baturini TaxID=241478 RepID=A0A183ILU9_9BILA|nr:unnamed protein product [Soboliphyme baturini]